MRRAPSGPGSDAGLAPTGLQLVTGKNIAGPRRLVEIGIPLGLYLVFTLVPFYWMVVFAVRPSGATSPVPWPITLDNFDRVWNELQFGMFFKNSLIVGVGTLICTSLIAVMTGYALARYRFKGRSIFMLVLLCTQFVPGAMLLIPLFLIFNHLHLINDLTALVIADTVFQLPLAAILMAGFIRKIPYELEEAAMIDGCTRFRGFLVVVLPLLRPAIVAVGSFAFIGSWNNFLFALMFMTSQERFTIPVGLSYTIGQYNADFGVLAAGGLVAAVPVVVVFAFIQKFLVQGLSAGAVKG